jgi:hypothetical protein
MSAPREKQNKVVVERTEKEYLNANGEVVGNGWEIKKEIVMCKSCREKTVTEEDEKANDAEIA